MENYVRGKCPDMCPRDERILREKQKLLHVLEIVQGTENTQRPKVDKNRAVKSFSRSAAGKSMQKDTDLRPPNILLKTVHYLLNEIVCSDELPWPAIYDFTMDRLRAIRQDLVIQNATNTEWISILQPIVKFHAYAAYRLCPEHISRFDPTINRTHLQECLKRLLSTYDDADMTYSLPSHETKRDFFEYVVTDRPDYEALYIVLNLGSEEALMRALSLKKILRKGIVDTCINLSLSYKANNFIRTCRIMSELPPILAGLASLHLPELRRKALMIMSVAYCSKSLKVPVRAITEFLLYDAEEQLFDDCKHYGLSWSDDGVSFNKVSFDTTAVTIVLMVMVKSQIMIGALHMTSFYFYISNFLS